MKPGYPATLISSAIVLCLTFFAANTVFAAQKAVKARIAVFPFENLSEDKDAPERVMPVIAKKLREIGVEVVDGKVVEDFLVQEMARFTGNISRDLARKAEAGMNVSGILVGSIMESSTNENDNPVVSFSARLVDASSGSLLWANYSSARGSDFAGILGLGKVTTMEELVPKAVDRLLRSFSTEPPRQRGKQRYKIAVMPFQNKSGVRNVSMTATYMFMAELFRNPDFDVIEYGELWEKIVELRVRYRGELDYRTLETLADSLGVDGILVGTVELYSSGVGTSSPPKVEISARLIDARIKGILWTETYQLSGEKTMIAFSWDETNPVDRVAFQVVTKLTKNMERALWY